MSQKQNQNKRGVILPGRAREIVHNVDKYFENEKQNSVALLEEMKTASYMSGPGGNITVTREVYASILKTLQNGSRVAERVHLATGINKNTLTRIRREWREAEPAIGDVPTSVLEPQIKLEVDEYQSDDQS